MVNKLEAAPEGPIKKGNCSHYWIIESPKGPTSRGVCQFCGEERDFDSYGPDSPSRWERDLSNYVGLLGSSTSGDTPADNRDNF
jgi:hypothetical protein